MKMTDVKVGTTYRVKVSGSVQDVRITGENPHGGWDGVNVATNRKVRIWSPQRLRSVAGERPAKRKKIVSLAEYEADAVNAAMQAVAAEKKKKRASGLDAAAQVLAEAGKPLNTKDMVERMLAAGLWKTGGKTPAATIYAAIIREISVKGDASRFRKSGRGHFELTAAGIAARTAAAKE